MSYASVQESFVIPAGEEFPSEFPLVVGGLVPKVYRFAITLRTTDSEGIDNHLILCNGASTGASANMCICARNENGQGTTDSSRVYFEDKCIVLVDIATQATVMEATMTANSATGFTLRITKQHSSDILVTVHAKAGGGEYHVGAFTIPNIVGAHTVPVTDSGINDIKAVEFLMNNRNLGEAGVHGNNLKIIMGMTDFTREYCVAMRDRNGQSPSQCSTLMYNDGCGGNINGSSGVITSKFSVTNTIPGGFDVDVIDDFPEFRVIYIAYKPQKGVHVNHYTQRTTTGDLSITDPGFKISDIYALTANVTAFDDSVDDDIKVSQGWQRGLLSSNANILGYATVDDVGTSDTATRYDNDNYHMDIDEFGAIKSETQIKTKDASGWTMTTTITTGVAVLVPYMVFEADRIATQYQNTGLNTISSGRQNA